ncbi:MAG: ribulose-phosphate 3-epimerase [Coprobacillaceae bacterium]
MVKIAPSLLAANFANLQQEIEDITIGGADWIHYDVMDGHFVPNISFGYSILNDIQKVTDLYLDVHLMISEPRKYVDEFIKAGASLIVFHIEAMDNEEKTQSLIEYIKKQGKDVGLSIKPDTPVSVIETYLSMLDVVLVMSVEPGFGGQSFNPSAIDKIKQLYKYREMNQYHYLIEVDGGINSETALPCKEAGVDVLVAGSSVFNTADYKEAITKLL